MTKIDVLLIVILIGALGLYWTAVSLYFKNKSLVGLPDGYGFYVKNHELTQKMLDVVPTGMNIMVYGTIQVNESLEGKGLKTSVITVGEGSSIEHKIGEVKK